MPITHVEKDSSALTTDASLRSTMTMERTVTNGPNAWTRTVNACSANVLLLIAVWTSIALLDSHARMENAFRIPTPETMVNIAMSGRAALLTTHVSTRSVCHRSAATLPTAPVDTNA